MLEQKNNIVEDEGKTRGRKKTKKKSENEIKYTSWWFDPSTGTSGNSTPFINNHDISLCVNLIHNIIEVEFTQIKRLIQYLNSVVKLCNALCININWTLPSGLEVRQGYLEQHTERIPLVSYSKKRVSIKYTKKNSLDKNKQVVALMPNLIHSLDAASLMILCEKFMSNYKNNASIFTVHDGFATTSDKVSNLLIILRSVYTQIYSGEPYLRSFDENIFDSIKKSYEKTMTWDPIKRELIFDGKTYEIHSIDLVYGKEHVTKTKVNAINRQKFILNLDNTEYILN